MKFLIKCSTKNINGFYAEIDRFSLNENPTSLIYIYIGIISFFLIMTFLGIFLNKFLGTALILFSSLICTVMSVIIFIHGVQDTKFDEISGIVDDINSLKDELKSPINQLSYLQKNFELISNRIAEYGNLILEVKELDIQLMTEFYTIDNDIDYINTLNTDTTSAEVALSTKNYNLIFDKILPNILLYLKDLNQDGGVTISNHNNSILDLQNKVSGLLLSAKKMDPSVVKVNDIPFVIEDFYGKLTDLSYDNSRGQNSCNTLLDFITTKFLVMNSQTNLQMKSTQIMLKNALIGNLDSTNDVTNFMNGLAQYVGSDGSYGNLSYADPKKTFLDLNSFSTYI
ncbi:MAG: hypothetical protein ACK5XN_12120, partial [Bacteroidota bacterium]